MSICDKIPVIVFFTLCSAGARAQLTEISTGTNQRLTHLSVVNNDVFVGGLIGYAGRCTDSCDSLVPLIVPGPEGNALSFFRLNLNEIYCVSYNPYQLLLFKSMNSGISWTQKLDTSASLILLRNIAFYNELEGIITKSNSFIRTTNGGVSWTNGTTPFIWPEEITAVSVYGDSTMCIGTDAFGHGAFYLSNDRGHTWPYAWGLGLTSIKDIAFLSKDTILVLSLHGGLSKTVNGGVSWSDSGLPIYRTYDITFRDKQEGYVAGEDINGYGMIARTKDMGASWETFSTQVYATFFKIEMLNDSIALISGANGVLLKWKYNDAVFTGFGKNYFEKVGLKIFPNPVADRLHFEFDSALSQRDFGIRVSNVFGQLVYSENNFGSKKWLDVSFLESGVYYLSAETDNGYKVFKLVKE